eukprot:gene2000-2322_t
MSIQLLAGFQAETGMGQSSCEHGEGQTGRKFNGEADHYPNLQFGASSRPHGCAKRGGRPVTWIGGGGMDPKKLAGLGVPALRALFAEVFGEATASNNAGWLRRKLAECPDQVHGQRRSPVVRARDSGAAIWNCSSPAVVLMGGDTETNPTLGSEMWGRAQYDDLQQQDAALESSLAEQDTLQGTNNSAGQSMDVFGTALGSLLNGCSLPRRSLKRSAPSAESADTLGYRSSVATRLSPTPSGSGSASPTATGGATSPQHQPCSSSRDHCSKQEPHLTQLYSGCELQQGSMVLPHCFDDSYLGVKVLVYWPADHQWWEATICQLNTADKRLQLLYTDMTEEEVSGHDFEELLRNGHLLLAGPQKPSCTNYSTGTLPVDGGECSLPQPCIAGAATAEVAAVAWSAGVADRVHLSAAGRSQSCALPRSTVCEAAVLSQDFSRSVSFGAGSAGTRSAEASEVDNEPVGPGGMEVAAKRFCREVPASTTGMKGDALGCGGLAEEIQQLRQLQLRLQRTVSEPGAAASGWAHPPACQAPGNAQLQLDDAGPTDMACGFQEQLSVDHAQQEDGDNLDDSFGARTSSCGDSLCESVADELAMAGLGADDAATYFSLFGAEGLLAEQQTGQAVSGQDAVGDVSVDAVAAAAQAEREAFAHMFDFD